MREEAERLLELVYDAVLDPALWNDFTDRLATSVGATSAVLFRLASERNDPVFFGIGKTELDQAAASQYQTHYHRVDEFAALAASASAPIFSAITAHSTLGPEILNQSEWYNDFLVERGYSHAGGIVMSEFQPGIGQRLAFTALRRHGDQDFDANDFALLNYLAPHIDRAVRIHERLGAADLARQSKLHALDRLSIGVAFLDRYGRVLDSNEAAQRIFDRNDGLTLSRGRIVAAYDQDQRRCDTIIRSATDGSVGSTLRGALQAFVARPSGERSYQFVVMPAAGPASRLLFAEAKATAFLFDMSKNAPSGTDFLASAYGLTPAEARLTLSLYDGMSVKEAAEQAGITENTARWTLKQIFSKLGVRSQAELVRLLASGPIGVLDVGPPAPGEGHASQ